MFTVYPIILPSIHLLYLEYTVDTHLHRKFFSPKHLSYKYTCFAQHVFVEASISRGMRSFCWSSFTELRALIKSKDDKLMHTILKLIVRETFYKPQPSCKDMTKIYHLCKPEFSIENI